MARQIETFPNPTRFSYPWHEWANGDIWALTPGEDFTCSIPSMRATIFNFAEKQMLKARTRVVNGELIVQFKPSTLAPVVDWDGPLVRE